MRDRSSTVIDPRGPNTHNTLRRIWIHTCIQEKEEEEQCHSLVVPSVLRPLPPRDGGWNDDGWTDRFSPNIRGGRRRRGRRKIRTTRAARCFHTCLLTTLPSSSETRTAPLLPGFPAPPPASARSSSCRREPIRAPRTVFHFASFFLYFLPQDCD